MADFAPPSGPPPPKVPAGWKAVWNEQYSEWFYVNTFSKKSQWEKPTEPVYGPGDDVPPPMPPPTYDHSGARPAPAEKAGLGSNNPYAQPDISEDEKLARQLQAEEDARVGSSSHARTGSRGEADSFYAGGGGYPSQGQAPPQDYGAPAPGQQKKGMLGKLFGKSSSSSHGPPPQQGYYGGGQAYPAQQQGYPPQGYYGGPPQGGYYGGGYPQQPQPQYVQQPPRRHGGMGAGGAAALGVGGGLLGGMLLGEAMDGGDDGGGDYGGGDDGGGDFGGGDDGGGGGD